MIKNFSVRNSIFIIQCRFLK